MKFGKLADTSQVDFRLAPDPPSNNIILDRYGSDNASPLQIFMGATGWSMPQWKTSWYPAKARTADFLLHYGRQFNSIELNTTHYRIPDSKLVQKWYDQTPADFRFCPKIPQKISHQRNLGLGEGSIDAFCTAINGLQEKLGCCFIQLPPYFATDRLALLERFLQAWPSTIPLAVELRHESWYADQTALDQWVSLLEKYRIHTVITDVAGRRDVLHLRLSSSKVMIRFVGNGLIDSDFSRAEEWIRRWQDWQALGLKELFLFPHQPDNLLAPEMSAHFSNTLAQQDWVQIRGPVPIPAVQEGDQMQLF